MGKLQWVNPQGKMLKEAFGIGRETVVNAAVPAFFAFVLKRLQVDANFSDWKALPELQFIIFSSLNNQIYFYF